MNRNIFYILTSLFLIGCSTEQEENPIKEEYYVSFSNNISYNQIIAETRAGIFQGTYIPQNEIVGIYGFNSTKDKVNENQNWQLEGIQPCNNEPYKSLGESKILKSENNREIKFPADNNAALAFYGYYPYQREPISSVDGPLIELDINREMEKTPDYLYTGNVPVIPTDKITKVALPFKHALSCLNFHISTNQSAYVNDNVPILKEIEVKTISDQSGYMRIKDGVIVNNEDSNEGEKNTIFTYKTEFPIHVNNSIEPNTDTGANFLFKPTGKTGNAIQEITLYVQEPNNGPIKPYIIYRWETGMREEDAIALERGCKYIIKIDYNIRITYTIHEVTQWKQGESYDGDKGIIITD